MQLFIILSSLLPVIATIFIALSKHHIPLPIPVESRLDSASIKLLTESQLIK